MSQRSAAFVLDNFLSNDKWQYITDHVNQSNFLSTNQFDEWRDSFYEEVIGWTKALNNAVVIEIGKLLTKIDRYRQDTYCLTKV